MKLFEPVKIGSMELKNRLVFPPIGTRLTNHDGTVSQRLIDYYARRAQGGVGLVVMQITAVDPHHFVGRDQPHISDDGFLPGLSRLAEAIKENGARAAVQLHHPGRQSRASVTGSQPVAPSPIPSPVTGETPRELSVEEIGLLVNRFAEAAERAKQAGFDAVELHGAHGYLLCQFLSPYSNKRTDQYGGDIQGRARFPLEIVAAIRRRLGRDYPIIFRFSAEEHVPGGLALKDTKVLARLLEEAGVDCLSVSAGTAGSMEWAVQPVTFRKGCLVPLAASIREETWLPVIAVGRINDPALAEQILEQGKADLVAVGRGLLSDPDFPIKAQRGEAREIRQCIACMTCMDQIGGKFSPIACLINPEVGHEGERENPAPVKKRVLVVGGGPAGLEAARIAALRGHLVALWEENHALGGRWSWLIRGCISEQVNWLNGLGVKIELSKEITPETVAAFKPDVLLITRGASPVVPRVPGADGDSVVAADEVLSERKKVAGGIAVLGAGNIGCEVAQFLLRRGAKVTVLEAGPSVAYGLENNTGRAIARELTDKGVTVLTGVKVTAIGSDGVHYQDAEGKESLLPCDWVVVALGSQPTNEPVEQFRALGVPAHPLPYCQSPQDAYRTGQEAAVTARSL